MKNVLSALIFLTVSAYSIAAENSVYDFSWLDQDKEVYVLQNRKFRKDGAVYVGLMGGIATSGTFTDTTSVAARAGYFFREQWGIELVFANNNVEKSETANNLKSAFSVQGFFNTPEAYTGAMLMWSPFYSKINTFNKIAYFDFILGLGLASIDTLDNRQEVPTSGSSTGVFNKETETGVILNIGTRFYINESWSFRIDLTPLLYNGFNRTPGTTENGTDLHTHYDLTIGFNYSL